MVTKVSGVKHNMTFQTHLIMLSSMSSYGADKAIELDDTAEHLIKNSKSKIACTFTHTPRQYTAQTSAEKPHTAVTLGFRRMLSTPDECGNAPC